MPTLYVAEYNQGGSSRACQLDGIVPQPSGGAGPLACLCATVVIVAVASGIPRTGCVGRVVPELFLELLGVLGPHAPQIVDAASLTEDVTSLALSELRSRIEDDFCHLLLYGRRIDSRLAEQHRQVIGEDLWQKIAMFVFPIQLKTVHRWVLGISKDDIPWHVQGHQSTVRRLYLAMHRRVLQAMVRAAEAAPDPRVLPVWRL